MPFLNMWKISSKYNSKYSFGLFYVFMYVQKFPRGFLEMYKI